MQQQTFADCFASYQSIAEMLKTCEYEEILEFAAGMAGNTPEMVEQHLMGYSEGICIGTHRSVVHDLQKNIAQYDWLYTRLKDDISRMVLVNLISYRIFPGQFFLEAAYSASRQDPMPGNGLEDSASIGLDGTHCILEEGGAIPYLLYKNHGCDVSMVGMRKGDYPNLKYVKELKLEVLPDDTLESRINYLRKEACKIDALLFYGAYIGYLSLAEVYKNLNPKGKIYLALDANSYWMDWIQWAEPEFSSFLDQCDVIGAAGHVLQRHLNEKWPWVIEYLPNGFYNFAGIDMNFCYEEKKNVILNVARLGTEQKATHIILEAFAAIAGKIPDWNLHLAGSIEEEWKEEYLPQFWKRFPELRGRICFLGEITDREVLYREYLYAKVFALSSHVEGGCPNVIAEALYAGDAIAITKIDEYRDAIDNGNCGQAAECGDVAGFADILLQLCQKDDLEKMCRRAHAYARENFDMERIADRLYYMLFGEE